jgi:uncharacterized repeat protein (TIGR01451 family)
MTEERSQSALFGAVSKELLAGGMGFRFQARGRSMAPSIWDGEIVHVQPVAVETLCKGDIVLFSDGARFLAHRLVKAGPGALVTQGDAALERDSIVRPEQILGKVIAKEENADGVTRVVKLGAAPARCYRVRRAFAGLAGRVVGMPSKLGNRLFARGTSCLAKLLVVLFSLTLALPALGQVAFDSTTENGTTGPLTGAAPSFTITHTTSGTNTLLLVGVSLNISGNTGANVSGITYNGIPLTFVGAHNDSATTPTMRVEIWSLVGPATGTYNIVTSFFLPGGTGSVGAVVGANTFTGVDQYQPLRTFVSSSGAAGTYSMLDIPSGINEYAMDVLAAAGSITITGYTTGSGSVPDTMEWNDNSGTTGTDVSGSSATHAGTTSIPMAETFSGTSNWSVAGISVKPVQADVGVSVTSTSALYPANLTYNITVTNYGPTPATNVVLTDTLATGLTSVQFSSSQVSCSGTYPTYTCAVGNLATNASVQVVVTATPNAYGTYTNTASVTASQADYNTLNNSFTAIASSQQTSCASSTAPPAGGTLTGVINTYFPGNGSAAAAATTIPVLAATSGGGPGIASGDLLLVIQMQGASINDSNTSIYGNGASGAGYTNLNNTGNYEYVTATSAYGSGAGSIPIKGAGPGGGLLFSYISSAATTTQGRFTFQVVRVPQYSTATLSSTLTALAWNGSTGGILAVDIAGTLTLGSATVVLDGFGFRGAAGLQLTGAGTVADDADYVYVSPTTYTGAAEAGAQGGKAEGIAGTPAWVNSGANYYLGTGTDYPDGTTVAANGGRARGAPGNAGGGGTDGDAPNNDDNSGGGGGGNGGGGGGGGDSWDSTLGVGGLGGSAFPANINRVVLGGGGGSGTRNNSPGDNQASSGSAGGGIVMIRAGGLSGSATITANGLASYNGTSNDAGGGGGAGGSIIVLSSSGGESGLTISAQGGTGGDAWDSQGFTLQNRHGPGGGGGGGVVLLSGAAASVNVSGAANGMT